MSYCLYVSVCFSIIIVRVQPNEHVSNQNGFSRIQTVESDFFFVRHFGGNRALVSMTVFDVYDNIAFIFMLNRPKEKGVKSVFQNI